MDFQVLTFLDIIKETEKSYLAQTTLRSAVWIPKSQVCKIDWIHATITLLWTFKIGGENGEYLVMLNDPKETNDPESLDVWKRQGTGIW